MADILPLFAASGLVAVVLASLVLWSRRSLRIKTVSVLIAALFLPASYSSLVTLLGRPKPMNIETVAIDAEEANVVAVQMQEGEAIYLWLNLPGVAEPRAYVLPWDEKTARELHEAGQEAEGNGTNVRMRMAPASVEDENDQVFYATPQQAPAPKQNASGQPNVPG